MHAANGFAPLPQPFTRSGDLRRTGVEVEFSGLSIGETCDVIAKRLGGSVDHRDPFLATIEDTRVGRITVELDTPARHASDNRFVKKGLEFAQAVVPAEIISEPLDQSGLETFNTLIDALRQAGAIGSRSGAFLGFGVHLNPEVIDATGKSTVETIRAFALLEQYLRRIEDLDFTRRALPFVQPWPESLVSELVSSDAASIDAFFPLIASHITTRNHGLDLFPLLKHVDEDAFAKYFNEDKTSARPTYHFRLPDCRIDEPDWDLTQPWALWHLVESVANTPALMDELGAAWFARKTGIWQRNTWTDSVSDILAPYKLGEVA